MITPRKQPTPGGFESSEIAPINDQIPIDLSVERNLRIDGDIGQAKRLRDERHNVASRRLLQSYNYRVPLGQKLRQWMIVIRTLPTPGSGKLPKFAAFHLEHQHSAGRTKN